MSAARFDIERIAITVQGVPSAWAGRISSNLEAALLERLGALRPAAAAIRIDAADLGVLDTAPAMDERAFVEAIAGRLVDWIGRQAGRTDGKDEL